MIDCVFDRWTPGIGDPSIMGWLTVVVYLVAAGLAFLRGRKAIGVLAPAGEAPAALWFGLASILFLFAVNKQLDLQSALTAAGRCASFAQGWYDERAEAQRLFVIGVALIGIGAFILTLVFMRKYLRSLWLLLSGFFLLFVFIVIRASSIHRVDAIINAELIGVRVNWLLELGALGLVIIGLMMKPQAPTNGPRRKKEKLARAEIREDHLGDLNET